MWFRRKSGDDARELRYHFERLVREGIAEGLTPVEAQRRARRELGGLDQIGEECRDVRGRWLEDFAKDLRYTARALGRSPGFLVVSVLSLALGVGANTAIFSLIDALMLRSLPVKDPGQLVHITRVDENGGPLHVSWQLFLDFRDNMKTISGAAAQKDGRVTMFLDGADEVVNAAMVTGNQFTLLGVEPAAGRLLEPADDTGSPAAVISYQYWKRRFGMSPAAIGKTFTLQGQEQSFTIVGVTPPYYHGAVVGDDPEITVPLTLLLSAPERTEPTFNNVNMIGRLRPGVTRAQANAELQVLWHAFQKRVAAGLPEQDRHEILGERAAVLSGRNGFDPLRDRYSEALLVLMGMVALVLLLACANLSGLLLARASSREREISIRLALGAGRGRLLRQFLAESFVLAALGGTLGLLLARWFAGGLVAAMAKGEELSISIAPDWRVLGFTAGVSLVACVLAGLAPGMHALRASLNAGLRQARSGGHQRLGRALVIAQVSISMVLVTGAALFAATLVKLYGVNRGMRTGGILTFTLRTSGTCPPDRCRAAAKTLLDRVMALPGVRSASAVDVLPISGSLWDRDIEVKGYTFRPGEDETAAFNAIAPRYFATVQTPLLRGREFDARDTRTSPRVTIVNETFARYFFGNSSPLGRTVTSNKVTYEIVGVAADARYSDLKQALIKTMYIPWTQRTEEEPTDFWFLARVSAGDPLRLTPMVDKLVREADPVLRLDRSTDWSTIIDRTIVTERIMAALGGFFGLLALIVACLGIFGVMAFRVSRRVNEIGVRMALGAGRSGIVALVLRDAAAILVVGSLLGAAGALGLSRLVRSMLFEVSPADPAVFALAAAVLMIAGLAAGWLPARRASRIDPMAALRAE